MRIGVVSDSHGRRLAVTLALAELRERGITTVLHCGDIDGAETVALFRGFTSHFVFGNCDIDKEALRAAIADIGGTLHDPFGSIELEGVKIAFLHGDDHRMMRDVEQSGYYDFFFTDTHTRPRSIAPARPVSSIQGRCIERVRRRSSCWIWPMGKSSRWS